ncbi:MAG: putative Fe-S oxidoreductase [Bacteroidetes bacterium]|nr:MAG: putative Fe-S oxidoreductase [Bacteroidota bacterium]
MQPIMKSNSKGDLTDLLICSEDLPHPGDLKALFKANRSFLGKTVQMLSKFNPRELDRLVHDLHDQAFSRYDCLTCANCCRNISPAISHNDVEQLSKKIKVRPSEIVTRYLKMDEEGDFVFTSAPCPFIDGENYCSVYSHRPKACREYPHTDRSRFYQLLKLSLKNAEICPVVYAILMKLG